MVHLLSLGAECLPTRDQNVNSRCVAEYLLGKSRDAFDDMLTAIEHQEHALLAQERQNYRQRLLRIRRQAHLGCKQTREQPCIFDGREIEEVNGPLKLG